MRLSADGAALGYGDRVTALLSSLLGDRARPILALVLLAWLGFMGWHYAQVTTTRSAQVAECSADPSACDSEFVFLALVEVEAVEPQVRVRKSTRLYTLTGLTETLSPGEVISVVAHIPEDPAQGYVVETLERHPLRKWKVRLSTLGLVVSLGVLLGGFRWEQGRVVERG